MITLIKLFQAGNTTGTFQGSGSCCRGCWCGFEALKDLLGMLLCTKRLCPCASLSPTPDRDRAQQGRHLRQVGNPQHRQKR